jgi:hypothetical protein
MISTRSYQQNQDGLAAIFAAAAANGLTIYTPAEGLANGTLGTTTFATKTGGKIRARAWFSAEITAGDVMTYYIMIGGVTLAVGTAGATGSATPQVNGYLEATSAAGFTAGTNETVVFGWTSAAAVTFGATAAGIQIQEVVTGIQ